MSPYGNKRAAWNCAIVFLGINGHPLAEPLDVDKVEEMVLAACQGRLGLSEISAALCGFVGIDPCGSGTNFWSGLYAHKP